ncbi:uncharacterized protein LOC114712535 [Neltuma alba]|uniref:uncharacterized protein LOC114712535 n=1 Tax=Neltuma alba TaxID=207710 RepID=UPI0010A490A4|nr:uncharacterized protein LOC114712535 [Prosopis alba]
MGAKIDHSKNQGQGPYCFVLSGMNYHSIGSLLPPKGCRPVYSQLYIYDTENEVGNRISAFSKHQKDSSLDPKIVASIKSMLDEVNPFVQQYRYASSMINVQGRSEVKLHPISTQEHDGRMYNMPSTSEAAALIVGDIDMSYNVRDIIGEEVSGSSKRINELHTAYLPLQYPILFPYREDGYRDDIEHREETLHATKKKKRLSMREYFTYRIMIRCNEIRIHQKELRVDLYQGLSDALTSGERDASSTGKRIILPSSFTGGARYMLGNYQDAMGLCRWAGYLDLFITFTCNPAWVKVSRLCEPESLHPSDRPDILSRVFKMKLQSLMRAIKEKKIFGRVRVEVYTIEFQKRGLPHAHILLFLDPRDKIKDPGTIDQLISAEIPDKASTPELYDLVKKFMIHGPCGSHNLKSPCMKDQKCTKYFPKKFNSNTTIDDDGYPTYKRRDDGRKIEVKSIPLDNRYVVPYNPLLLHMFQAHINVEKCNQLTAIKYLFKYISKVNDRVVTGIFDADGAQVFDEIQQYCNCRYISACEASWRIFGYDIHHRYPAVERLSFHLPNQQYVIYFNSDDVAKLMEKQREAATLASGNSLRKMFVSMLLCCCLNRPDHVWNETSKLLSEDMFYVPRANLDFSSHHIPLLDKQHATLNEIDKLLKANGRSLNDFPSLPLPVDVPTIDVSNKLILQELNYDRESLHLEAKELIRSLNSEQKEIFDRVMSSLIVDDCKGRFFFVYGYRGTGKTFLWNALTYALRAKGDIVLTVASSGIAVTLLPSGRTAHSKFAIPIQINDSSICSIKQNSPLGHLIKCMKLIIWDEAPMVQHYCVEAVDRTFKDIMHCQEPFGGKCIVMGGDFRQILPVIPKGSRATIVDACITSLLLWNQCTVFRLTRNMRLNSSSINQGTYLLEFSKWLLDVGDGNLGLPHDGVAEIEIPHEFLLTNYTNPFEAIVSSTYSNLCNNFSRNGYFTDRAILAPTIEYVNEINEYMCSLLPGESVEYLSCDTVCRSSENSDSFDNLYTTKFLNSINCSGLPSHKLSLKVGAPVMLLRNIDQASGLCNGTRLRISQLGKTVIEAITLNGSKPNEKVLLHRMDMNPSESRWPFRMQRRQFPITLSFAMTINKSQGQSLNYKVLKIGPVIEPVKAMGQGSVGQTRVKPGVKSDGTVSKQLEYSEA